MKTIRQYIEEKLYHQQVDEKLIINKDFKDYNYSAVQPNKSGKCLLLRCAVSASADQKTRVDCSVEKYTLKEFGWPSVDCTKCDSDNKIYTYYKNKNGYYVFGRTYNGHPIWEYVLLFGDDAIRFLEQLMNDLKSPINVKQFIGDAVSSDEWMLKPLTSIGRFSMDPFEKSEIKTMINELLK